MKKEDNNNVLRYTSTNGKPVLPTLQGENRIVSNTYNNGVGRMVFENPAGEQHYLTRYWCLKPSIIDKDRRNNGDAFKKPTQYWFIGFEPKQNLIFEALDYVETKTWSGLSARERSEIHPQYASRFIRQYLIEPQESEDTDGNS